MEITLSQLITLSKLTSASFGTSLVTLYVPGSSNMNMATSKLSKELSSASNIKSKSVRNDVVSALTSLQIMAKSLGNISHENGYVFIAGNTSQYV